MNRRTTVGLAGLLISLALAAPVMPQSTVDHRAQVARDASVLRDRGREMLHPGDPLTLIGNEQDQNSFRERSPGLKHAALLATTVDPQAQHARRIAMYDQGSIFRSPLAAPPSHNTRMDSHGYPTGSRRKPNAPVQQPASDIPDMMNWWMLILVALTVPAIRTLRARTRSTKAT